MESFCKLEEVCQIDTLLINGDHSCDSRGIPISVTDDLELIQQALLRLSIKKGSFKEDPSLGSELYKLREIRGGDDTRMAQSYVQEALLSMSEIEVSSVRLERYGDTLRLSIGITISQSIPDISQNQYQLEVDVN